MDLLANLHDLLSISCLLVWAYYETNI